jgi:HD-GYP domain-containing protein (c-di-GMP phosphodiesterase class II)
MVRLSEIIKEESLKKTEASVGEKPAQKANEVKEETVDQEAFEKLESGIQFKEIVKEKKEEIVDQEVFEKVDTGIHFQGIVQEKRETAKKPDNKEKIRQYEQLYDNVYEWTKRFVDSVKAGRKLSLSEAFKLFEQVIDNPESLDILYRKAIYAKGLDTFISHLVNVMVYSLKIGQGLGYKREKLVELAAASLLHDIGMIHVPDSIVNKTEKLSDEEFKTMRRHSIVGHEILSKLYPEYPWIAEVALQEHEREDGHGYPNGLKGDEINNYAKIVSIVDVFEALTHKRPQRKRYLPNDAVKIIVQQERDAFSKVIIKAMLTKLSAFPLYSYVRLNSKAIGMVVEIDEASPLRPAIQIMFDDKGRKVAGEKIVKLKDTPLLYITDAIYEEELPK